MVGVAPAQIPPAQSDLGDAVDWCWEQQQADTQESFSSSKGEVQTEVTCAPLMSESTVANLKQDYPMLSWPSGHLAVRTRFLFGAPFAGYYAAIYMKRSYMRIFYIDDYPRASLGLVTFFTVLGLLIDAFSDPFVANVSDNTRHRFGRRRPYILVGAIFHVAAFTLSYTPLLPPGVGASIWFGIFHILSSVSDTLVAVPLEGWGAEMTPHCKERSDLWMWRELCLVLGILVGAVLPAFLSNIGGAECSSVAADSCYSFPILSFLFSCSQLVCVIVLVWRGKERPMNRLAASRKMAWSEDDTVPTLVLSWLNKPFRIIVVGAITEAFGQNMPFAIMPFYTRIVLGHECMKPSTQFSLAAGVNLISRLILLPAWIRVGRRLGKFKSYLLFNFLLAGSSTLFIVVSKDDKQCGQLYLGLFLVALWGIIYSGDMFLKSVLSDIVDYDEFLSGRRREGQYMMTVNFLPKFLEIPAEALPFLMMAYLGYRRPGEDGVDVEQPESVVWLIRLCFSVVPGVCVLIGAIVLLWYPKAAWPDAAHAQIIDSIKNLHGKGLPANDPWFPGRVVPPPSTVDGPHDGLLAHFMPYELRMAVTTTDKVDYVALRRDCVKWFAVGLLLAVPGIALIAVGWQSLGDDLGASWAPTGLVILGLTVLLLWFHGTRYRAGLAVERLRVPRAEIIARHDFLCRYSGDAPLGEPVVFKEKCSQDAAVRPAPAGSTTVLAMAAAPPTSEALAATPCVDVSVKSTSAGRSKRTASETTPEGIPHE